MRRGLERKAAKAAGERFYETGKPCRNGHIAKRYTGSGACSVCAVEAVQKWQAKGIEHPERTSARERGETHYTTGEPCQNGHPGLRYVSNGICVDCDTDRMARYHAARPGLGAKWARDRRAKDPSGHRAEVKRWAQKNPEKTKEILDRWRENNLERARELARVGVAARRAREAACGGTITPEDIAEATTRQKGRCAECGEKHRRLEADHIIPLARGGRNDRGNLQMLCRSCNARKGARDPLEWAASRGRLC